MKETGPEQGRRGRRRGRPLRRGHPELRCDCSTRMSHLGTGRKTFWVEVQPVQEPCSRHTLGMWRAERMQVSRSTVRERGDGGPAAGTH